MTMSKKRSFIFYILGILSAIFLFTFVFAYFSPSLARSIGLWFIPMAVFGVAWEIYAAGNDILKNEHDPELTEKENIFIENFALVFINLFVVPGYFLGFVLTYKAIKGNL